MKYKLYLITGIFLLAAITGISQTSKKLPFNGKLFIIGGGSRSVELMQTLISTAQLKTRDYIVILPMSSEEPDTSFYYIQRDFVKVCSNTIAKLNFTKELVNDKKWLDSLQKAKLIFITGGDQNRFMGIVLHTPVYDAIKAAFANGATIAGTSAGAAVMSKEMITGNEYVGDSVVAGSFKKIATHMVEIKEGLGLVNTAIIDQHFIVRSRYNRLLSVLAAFPSYACVGIDEGTAIIVSGKNITVAGIGQVIQLSLPQNRNKTTKEKLLINLQNIRMDILTAGDHFTIP
jgi:cyanophycinase